MELSHIMDEHRILREDEPLVPFSGQIGGQMPIFAFQNELLVCSLLSVCISICICICISVLS